MYRPKVYTASKISHGPMWLECENLTTWGKEIEFTARWLRMPPGPDHATSFWNSEQKRLHWIQDIQDVKRSDWLVTYNDEAKDKLSGTLVEVGAAIAFLIPVIAVGYPDRHSWQSHPLVLSLPSIHEAFCFITGKETL